MKCSKCNGRMFLDRVFSDSSNFELYCFTCGRRKFIDKESEIGKWLKIVEVDRLTAKAL